MSWYVLYRYFPYCIGLVIYFHVAPICYYSYHEFQTCLIAHNILTGVKILNLFVNIFYCCRTFKNNSFVINYKMLLVQHVFTLRVVNSNFVQYLTKVYSSTHPFTLLLMMYWFTSRHDIVIKRLSNSARYV